MGAVQGPGHKFDFSGYNVGICFPGTGQAGVYAGVCAAVVSRDHLDSSEDSE